MLRALPFTFQFLPSWGLSFQLSETFYATTAYPKLTLKKHIPFSLTHQKFLALDIHEHNRLQDVVEK